ncbi:MAG: hypothetical protein K6G15_11950 [Desulfovibrio sp.]|nr:hypothetical protein [Desulfovibrio sp.]
MWKKMASLSVLGTLLLCSSVAWSADARHSAYLKAAQAFLEQHMLPNGEAIDKDELGGNFAENEFAICDVNGDGLPELLIRFQSGSMASSMEFVSGFDEKKGTLTVQLTATPGVEYFKNGCAKEKAAHNQGLAGEFWPYSFSVYDPKKGIYEEKGSVDAWSKEAYPTNPFDNDKPFPKAMDVTGDGFVYFINDASFQGAKEDQPVDTPVYQAWVGHYLGGAEPVKVEWLPATASGLKSLDAQ